MRLLQKQLILAVIVPIFGMIPAAFCHTAGGADTEPVSDEVLHPDWFKQSFLDLRDDVEEAASGGKKGIIVYFGQRGCHYCMALMKRDFGNREIADITRRNFDVIALDIHGDRNVTDLSGRTLSEHDFAQREQAQLTPALAFYDRRGHKILRLNGFYPPHKLRAALRYIVDGNYQQEPFTRYLARVEAESGSPPLYRQQKGLFQPPPYMLDRSHFLATRPLMVLFEDAHCAPCRKLNDVLLNNTAIANNLQHFEAIQLDMWSTTPVITPQGQRLSSIEWTERLGLLHAPSLVFFDAGGAEIYRIDSHLEPARINRILHKILAENVADDRHPP